MLYEHIFVGWFVILLNTCVRTLNVNTCLGFLRLSPKNAKVSLSCSHVMSSIASSFEAEDILSSASGLPEEKRSFVFHSTTEKSFVFCWRFPFLKITRILVPSGEKWAISLKCKESAARTIEIASATVTGLVGASACGRA